MGGSSLFRGASRGGRGRGTGDTRQLSSSRVGAVPSGTPRQSPLQIPTASQSSLSNTSSSTRSDTYCLGAAGIDSSSSNSAAAASFGAPPSGFSTFSTSIPHGTFNSGVAGSDGNSTPTNTTAPRINSADRISSCSTSLFVPSPLTAESLAPLSAAERKRLIGERLYSLICSGLPSPTLPHNLASQPSLCAKLTGMLLEMDDARLLEATADQSVLIKHVSDAHRALLGSGTSLATSCPSRVGEVFEHDDMPKPLCGVVNSPSGESATLAPVIRTPLPQMLEGPSFVEPGRSSPSGVPRGGVRPITVPSRFADSPDSEGACHNAQNSLPPCACEPQLTPSSSSSLASVQLPSTSELPRVEEIDSDAAPTCQLQEETDMISFHSRCISKLSPPTRPTRKLVHARSVLDGSRTGRAADPCYSPFVQPVARTQPESGDAPSKLLVDSGASVSLCSQEDLASVHCASAAAATGPSALPLPSRTSVPWADLAEEDAEALDFGSGDNCAPVQLAALLQRGAQPSIEPQGPIQLVGTGDRMVSPEGSSAIRILHSDVHTQQGCEDVTGDGSCLLPTDASSAIKILHSDAPSSPVPDAPHLPAVVHTCGQCGSTDALVQCVGTGGWYCNVIHDDEPITCILQHLIRNELSAIRLHPQSRFGEVTVVCARSNSSNLFALMACFDNADGSIEFVHSSLRRSMQASSSSQLDFHPLVVRDCLTPWLNGPTLSDAAQVVRCCESPRRAANPHNPYPTGSQLLHSTYDTFPILLLLLLSMMRTKQHAPHELCPLFGGVAAAPTATLFTSNTTPGAAMTSLLGTLSLSDGETGSRVALSLFWMGVWLASSLSRMQATSANSPTDFSSSVSTSRSRTSACRALSLLLMTLRRRRVPFYSDASLALPTGVPCQSR